MNKKTVRDIALSGKRVLLRVDFNVPLDGQQKITDELRIVEALPTIRHCLEQQAAKIIIMSHLGRPKGKVVDTMRLTPVARRLQELLNVPVKKLDDCVGEGVAQAVATAAEPVIVLENLRFYAEEEKNNADFARKLADLGDVYVNDAFGTAHRAHASTEGVTHYLPSVAGLLVEKEIKYLGAVVHNPARPFVIILGGAKVSDKILMINNLMDKVDALVIGGGMAYTFLQARGQAVGNSKVEQDCVALAAELLTKARQRGIEVVLPIDHVIADRFAPDAATQIVTDAIPAGWMGLDIGPQSVAVFKKTLATAKTVVWNGPVGVFEMAPFSQGTRELAGYLAGLNAVRVVGGGDTAAAVRLFGAAERLNLVSTGGGASLEFLEGLPLPGIAALQDAG